MSLCRRPLRLAAILSGLFLLSIASAHGQAHVDRAALIRGAQVWMPTAIASMDIKAGPGGPDAFAPGAVVSCEYEDKQLDGNSRKFACQLTPDDEVKVKFGGGNGEVFGEVAATRLLWALGFGADRMYPVRVICRGCPDDFGPAGEHPGERLVEPAIIERKLADEPRGAEGGWSWGELDLIDEQAGGATRPQRDALIWTIRTRDTGLRTRKVRNRETGPGNPARNAPGRS
jgi:hypothetical protein